MAGVEETSWYPPGWEEKIPKFEGSRYTVFRRTKKYVAFLEDEHQKKVTGSEKEGVSLPTYTWWILGGCKLPPKVLETEFKDLLRQEKVSEYEFGLENSYRSLVSAKVTNPYAWYPTNLKLQKNDFDHYLSVYVNVDPESKLYHKYGILETRLIQDGGFSVTTSHHSDRCEKRLVGPPVLFHSHYRLVISEEQPTETTWKDKFTKEVVVVCGKNGTPGGDCYSKERCSCGR